MLLGRRPAHWALRLLARRCSGEGGRSELARPRPPPAKTADRVEETLDAAQLGRRLRGKATRQQTESRQERRHPDDEEYEGHRKDERAIIRMSDYFKGIPDEAKSKKAFDTAIGLFLINNSQLRGHVEFVYAAMAMLKEYGVEKELSVYKSLMDLFPKGKMIPRSFLSADMLHYPRDQECAMRLIDTMEEYGVLIDKEFFDLVTNVFGTMNETAQKLQRLAYWQTKFVNLTPFPTPRILPEAGLDIARLAIKHMCPDPVNKITTFLMDRKPDSAFHGWIVSGQSVHQRRLIEAHDEAKPLFVDGPSRVWVRYARVDYFALSADPNPDRDWRLLEADQDETAESEGPEAWRRWSHDHNDAWSERRRELLGRGSLHEQADGTVLAVAATSNSTKDSAAAWVGALAKATPRLKDLNVVFRMRHIGSELQPQKSEPQIIVVDGTRE